MKVNRIAVIGECMVELTKHGHTLKQGFGGDTLNTAVYLSRLTHGLGVTTAYVTGLGQDSLSQDMLALWQKEKIDTGLVRLSDEKLPGLYMIETSEDGERRFSYWRSDSAAKFWLRDEDESQLIAELLAYQMIYLSGISLAILPLSCRQKLLDVLAACRAQGASIVFDNNYRPALWESKAVAKEWYQKILTLTDIALLTYDDEAQLWGDQQIEATISRTQQFGVAEIVLKRGADDCCIVSDQSIVTVPATMVDNVVDTTAAGDSFSAGYLAKRINGGSCADAAAYGHVIAGTVIQYSGALILPSAMPSN